MRKGFSLIETLVVIAVFAIIATVVARATSVSLLGSRKSDASTKVRENLSLAMAVIERQLRNASEITSACVGATSTSIDYVDAFGNTTGFACNPGATCASGTNTYISSGSAAVRLTNPEAVCITDCEFVCSRSGANLPPTVTIAIEGMSKDAAGIEDATVRLETGVSLRAY